MSKYIYRKETPLKWNTFLKFFGLPVCILAEFYGLYGILSDVFLLHLPHAGSSISSVILILGGSMQALGSYFWPVFGYVLYDIIVTLLTLRAWIGLLKWREYGARCLLMRYLLILCYYIVLCYFLTTNAFMVLMSGYAFLLSTTVQSVKTIAVVVIVFGTIITLLELLLTGIYYHKRKPLFDTYYQQPYFSSHAVVTGSAPSDAQMREGEAAAVEAEVVPLQETVTEDTVEPSVENEEVPAEETSLQEGEQTETMHMEIVETAKKIRTNFCPNCGTRIEDEKMRFCPNCGRSL